MTDARRAIRVYFVLAFALTWSIGGVGLLAGRWWPASSLSTSAPFYYLAAYAVSLTGLALTARYDGRDGLRRLGRRLIPSRSRPSAYAIVLAGYAVITAVALTGAALVQPNVAVAPNWTLFLQGLPLVLLRDPGPIGEEFGWRGFALPRMIDRLTPVDATIRLGLLHAAWHAPLFFIPGMPQHTVSWPLFVLGVVSLAVFDTALYLRTGANLLLAILVHLLANACGNLAVEAHALGAFFAAETAAAVLVVMSGGLKRPNQLG